MRSKQDIEHCFESDQKKAFVDFVYETNQALQTLSQSLIGLSLTYEKKVFDLTNQVKALIAQLDQHEKMITDMVQDQCACMNDQLNEMLILTEQIYGKTEDIYENFASLEDLAAIHLQIEDHMKRLYPRT